MKFLLLLNEEKQTVNTIFDSESYLPVYEKKNLMQARKSIYIASPGLNKNKSPAIDCAGRGAADCGVIATVITQPAESYPQTRVEPTKALQTALTGGGDLRCATTRPAHPFCSY